MWVQWLQELDFGLKLNDLLFYSLDISRCNALIAAQCLMNRRCVCFAASFVRLVGNHAAGSVFVLPVATSVCSVVYEMLNLLFFFCLGRVNAYIMRPSVVLVLVYSFW